MKSHVCPLLLAFLSLTAQAKDHRNLEVHEWGTLTVLSGSDGLPLQWYQSSSVTDELPSFVERNPMGGKAGLFPVKSIVRMETPVIYFYPEEPMRVSVSVTYKGGQVTEWFPGIKRSGDKWLDPLIWEGDLLAPHDEMARGEIPDVEAKGEHYRHAREVPDAWIFRSTTRIERPAEDPAKGKDTDKFVFYRGKGDYAPPYMVQAANDGTVTLRHWGAGGAIPAAFALTVKDGLAHWARMPQLAAARHDDAAALGAQVTARPDATGIPVEKASAALTAAMREALVAEGLTADEARAMVATWDGHWFREPGTRVLAILPRAWVDEVLPLTITPAPTKLKRVFVARFETLTSERETELLALLRENTADGGQSAKFSKLQLGRFASGALERAQKLEAQRMAGQFLMLQQMASRAKTEESPKTAVAR
jgi:hypothetical protein